MALWRSLLFVPVNRPRMVEKIPGLPADGFILDLEDTIPEGEKAQARQIAAEVVPSAAPGRTWVRVNPLDSPFILEDLEALVGTAGLAGFVIPKSVTDADVTAVDRMLSAAERARGIAEGTTQVIIQIENASAALFCHRLVTASDRIETAMYGSGEDGDMNVSLGSVWSSEGPEMMLGRQLTLLSVRAAEIAYPLDGVFANVADHEGFRRDTTLSRRLGYRGRAVIHPSQIDAANEIYTPSAAELDYSRRVIEAFAEAEKQGIASTTVDGKLVDVAMVKTAQNVLAHASSVAALTAARRVDPS